MRNFDIAAIDQTDGLSPRTCQKLNQNFRALGQQNTPNVQITQAQLDLIIDSIKPLVRDTFLEEAYPVGSVILTNTQNDPRLKIGTWHRTAQGKFLLSADDAHPNQTTGGQWETFLEADQLPPHTHTIKMITSDTGEQYGFKPVSGTTGDLETGQEAYTQTAIKHEPPYQSVLVYERVS